MKTVRGECAMHEELESGIAGPKYGSVYGSRGPVHTEGNRKKCILCR